jgi:Holliday junction resolvase RusA-like endonuclease
MWDSGFVVANVAQLFLTIAAEAADFTSVNRAAEYVLRRQQHCDAFVSSYPVKPKGKADYAWTVEEMSDTITIELPLPPKELHPNWKPISRGGAMQKARKVKRYRGECALLACLAVTQATKRGAVFPWHKATIQATFRIPRKRDDDGLNGWLKNARDALQGSVVVNDSAFTMLPPIQVTAKTNQGVRLEIRRIA